MREYPPLFPRSHEDRRPPAPALKLDRRKFLALAGGGVVASILASSLPSPVGARCKFRAIVFDAFPIFDPRPVFVRAESLFPGRGTELSNAWRTRQFEYTWLRTLSGHYADFWQVTGDALVFSARSLKLELSPATRRELMQAYLDLKVWPEVIPVLRRLKQGGMQLAFLSNFTRAMLNAGIANSGLQEMFDHVLSTDAARAFKPDAKAYQLGLDSLHLPKEEILFVAFAGWDAAGAKWFGYPTYWVNRLNLPPEELAVLPDGTGSNLDGLAGFVGLEPIG
jgi:2-haloacid dehalogenase